MTDKILIDRATLEKALKLAFNLGQTYWAQADSEYVSQQNKSGGTREKFNQLITDTCAALAGAEPKKAEDMAQRRLGPNGGVPYNEQLEIARRWDRAVDAGSPITARSRHELP